MNAKIALLAGDGIGPEIVGEAVKVLDAVAARFSHTFTYESAPVGAAAIDLTGDPYPESTHNVCLSADAVLFGAIGDPKYDNDPTAKVRPEQGLLRMRKSLGLFANVRPNDKVKVTIKRDGDVKQIDVTLRNKAGKTDLITKEDVDVAQALGGKFAEINDKAKKEFDINGGIQVVQIKAGGLLSKARVREGFIITHINDRQIRSVSDLNRITDKVTSIDGIYPNGRSASYTFVE